MTNLRTTLAALLVGASSLAMALPASAQDAGVDASADTGVSITGDTDNGGMSATPGANAGASVDDGGITASISGDTDADVDTTLGSIAANTEGSADAEADVMARIDGMSEADMQRVKDRCDDISKVEMQDENVLEVCNIIMKHDG
jgi:hypothetical protein